MGSRENDAYLVRRSLFAKFVLNKEEEESLGVWGCETEMATSLQQLIFDWKMSSSTFRGSEFKVEVVLFRAQGLG